MLVEVGQCIAKTKISQIYRKKDLESLLSVLFLFLPIHFIRANSIDGFVCNKAKWYFIRLHACCPWASWATDFSWHRGQANEIRYAILYVQRGET
ncbi:hypothetical protein [Parageobacillus thermoglucosidasius]|uniref:Mobile element protein n=1 Tax=Parageobacillus thermoglucosidasius TaxID=1426 RepID=A0AB38QUH5_PARTM|nr:hypothetical protein [Parageobacillus thermoglucosidasius]UOE74760.1 hypothetical protein IMI45_10235 [Parageobacillus thermoglucosidasius]